MNKTATEPQDEPPSSSASLGEATEARDNAGIIDRMKSIFVKERNEGTTLREAIEEYMEEADENGHTTPEMEHERVLISNVLKIRDLTVVDVMIPRADIISIDINTPQKELLSLLAEKQFSRLPVYRDTLDEVVGTLHIKDLLASIAAGKKVVLKDLVREVPIVSPALPVLDLLLMMKKMKKHMVLVVDEFGGIDGLVTIGDIIEATFGEIEDEYDQEEAPQIIEEPNGSIIADGRLDLDIFEEKYGHIIPEIDIEDVDTIGGFVCSIADRVPARGEILNHEETGMVFEILDADPRRVNRIRIRNIPNAE